MSSNLEGSNGLPVEEVELFQIEQHMSAVPVPESPALFEPRSPETLGGSFKNVEVSDDGKRYVKRKGQRLILYRMTKSKTHVWDFIFLMATPVSHFKVKDYTSAHAVGAWCLKCGKTVTYVKGDTSGVRYHMSKTHPSHTVVSSRRV